MVRLFRSARTLVYTRGGLVALFSWLLWGDFIFQLMETVEPKILPILLKGHGASDFQTALIAGSLMRRPRSRRRSRTSSSPPHG